jgi:hypothetical protein
MPEPGACPASVDVAGGIRDGRVLGAAGGQRSEVLQEAGERCLLVVEQDFVGGGG